MSETMHQGDGSPTERQEPTEPQEDFVRDQAEDQEDLVELAEVKIFNEIEKRENDNRDYRGVILKNGLRVMLISDSEATIGAVSLDVGVGSWSDPPELQGLAHYVEHLLFLGTEKVTAFARNHSPLLWLFWLSMTL